LTAAKRIFFDSNEMLIAEWSPFTSNPIYEPGHTFEWACLLMEAKQAGFDISEFDCITEMVKSAEQKGLSATKVV